VKGKVVKHEQATVHIYEVHKIMFDNINGKEYSDGKTVIINVYNSQGKMEVRTFTHSSQYYPQIPSELLYL
jgi:hypothetical protein